MCSSATCAISAPLVKQHSRWEERQPGCDEILKKRRTGRCPYPAKHKHSGIQLQKRPNALPSTKYSNLVAGPNVVPLSRARRRLRSNQHKVLGWYRLSLWTSVDDNRPWRQGYVEAMRMPVLAACEAIPSRLPPLCIVSGVLLWAPERFFGLTSCYDRQYRH